jgi:hypothetical protein
LGATKVSAATVATATFTVAIFGACFWLFVALMGAFKMMGQPAKEHRGRGRSDKKGDVIPDQPTTREFGSIEVTDLNRPAGIRLTGKLHVPKDEPPLPPGLELAIAPTGVAVFAGWVLWHLSNLHYSGEALRQATWIWLFTILGGMLFSVAWAKINQTPEPDIGARLRSGAQVLITVDGVVLGLVYKYAPGQGLTSGVFPTVAQVGAGALLVSIATALLAYTLFSGKIEKRWAYVVSTGVFNVSAYALMYGLICFVSALIWPL